MDVERGRCYDYYELNASHTQIIYMRALYGQKSQDASDLRRFAENLEKSLKQFFRNFMIVMNTLNLIILSNFMSIIMRITRRPTIN